MGITSENRPIRVQFWADFVPSGTIDGAGAYAEAVLEALMDQPDVECEVVLLWPQWPLKVLNPAVRECMHVLPASWRRIPLPNLAQVVNAVYGRVPLRWRHWIHVQRRSGGDRRLAIESRLFRLSSCLRRKLRQFSPDCVIVNYARMGPVLEIAREEMSALRIMLTHDVLHQRSAAEQYFGQHYCPRVWTRAEERTLLNYAEVLVAIQSGDAELLRDMCSDQRIVTAPVARRCVDTSDSANSLRCLFVGSNVNHNIAAVEWFVDQVWPRVLRKVPLAQMVVAGTVGQELRRASHSILILGQVPNLTEHYHDACVCVVPLQFGSGLKIKLIDALAHGRTCVSTSVGLQGVEFLEGEGVLKADEPESFAMAVVKLMLDTAFRRRQEQKASGAIDRWFSPNACYGELLSVIRREVAARRQSAVAEKR